MHRGLDGCYYSNTADDLLQDEVCVSVVNIVCDAVRPVMMLMTMTASSSWLVLSGCALRHHCCLLIEGSHVMRVKTREPFSNEQNFIQESERFSNDVPNPLT